MAHDNIVTSTQGNSHRVFKDIQEGGLFRYARGNTWYIRSGNEAVSLRTGVGYDNQSQDWPVVPLRDNETITLQQRVRA